MANKLRRLASSTQWFNCNHDCNKNISRFLWKSRLGVKILIVHILSTLQHNNKKTVKTGKTGRLKKAF